jgi:glycosyltransferase involved in cell wall biosynthesis
MKKKITIISSRGVWSPGGVGGSDSYLRRLTLGLQETGHRVEHVFIEGGLYDSRSLRRTIRDIGDQEAYKLVYRLSLYHRLMFILFDADKERTVSFIPFSSIGLKRYIVYKSYLMVGRKIAVVSSSLFAEINSLTNKKVCLLLPPVPESFLSPNKTKERETIIFVGRVDERKGVDLVADLFDRLSLEYNCIMYGVHIPGDEGVLTLHKRCIRAAWKYVEVSQEEYNEKLDVSLKKWLDSATYFIQPYRSIGSTVDTPLLLLEALSRSCTILTSNIDQTKFLNDEFRLGLESFVEDAITIIRNSRRDLNSYNHLLSSPRMQANKLIDFIYGE